MTNQILTHETHRVSDLCPFCKSDGAEVVQTHAASGIYADVFVVQCDECLCQGPAGETAAQAVESWEARHTIEFPPAVRTTHLQMAN